MIRQKLSDRYEIVSELGRGGMGVVYRVYRARDPILNREVAVKLITPSLLTPETERRFQTEAQLVARMDHPSIVSIYDFGRHEGSLFFVMPIVQGESLRQPIREQTLLLGDILDIGVGVAEVLEYSHARGVVHRDIKPENIMVSREEARALRVRVMDFGLARGTRVTRVTKTGMLLGTMAYVSPEQVKGKPVDGRSDIYSLGTVLYECIVNDVPFSGEMQSILYRIVHELPQSPRALGADIDEELEGIILSCLTKEPEQRPQSAGDLARSLRHYRAKLRESERMKSVTVTRSLQVQRPALSPFVGREKELKELQQRLNSALRGECQLAVISGEPGIGKTRLMDELENLAKARQIRVLHGRFVERDSAFPYHGFCEAVQEYFRQKELSSLSSAMPDFSDLGADLIALFPMLSEIEAIRSAAAESPQSARGEESRSPEDRSRIFELLARTLTRLAAGKPLLLLLEDLHGAEVSLEALPYIVRRLGPTPTLIVGTYRSTDIDPRHPLVRMVESFQGDRRFASIRLGPFSLSEHRLFLATLVGGTEIVDDLARKLYEGTEGNPFFTKELVRSLLDAGNIVQDDTGSWTLSGGREISSDALPATIQQAVERRIGNLPDDLRNLLSVASVMGKTFDFRDLEALAEGKEDLDEAVDRLVQEGLIEEDPQSRGDRLTFSSGVVREVLNAGLPRRRRRLLHRRYAQVLERRYAGRLERVYPQLVHHACEGDLPEKAVEYGLLHARSSLEAFSPEEAIRSVKNALEFLDEEWEGDRSLEAEGRMLLAEGYRMAGDAGGALKEIEAATRIFEREGRTDRSAGALLTAARTAWHARQTEQAREWAERGIEVARAAGQTESLRQLLSLAVTLANLRGEYEKAREHLREAERLAPVEETRAKEEIPPGGRLVVALANPLMATEPAAIKTVEEPECFANVFEPLLSTDAEGNLVPALCESWEARDGGRSFLLTLRRGIRFHDGHPMAAEDIKKSFESSIRRVAPVLPAAFEPIRGVSDFIEGRADGVGGIVVQSEDTLEIQLDEPLPIYPALLTDVRGAVTRVPEGTPEAGTSLVGTGRFRLASRKPDRIVLEPNPRYWKGTSPKLDAVEFRPGLTAAAIAHGLRSGEIDLARDLLPEDLEAILRDPRFRGGLVETPQKMTYFILFNSRSGPVTHDPVVRQALSGVVRARDLVWETLGRFAQPASSLLPPGILGHDPGRRPRLLSVEQAREMLRSAGLPESVRLKAAVHPLIQDRYGALLRALLSAWGELGVKVSIETADMPSFLRAWRESSGLDLWVGRWLADYDDPDNFAHTLFHSATGLLRSYYCSPEADQILESARAESRPAARESLYRKFESLLQETVALLPLFHDVDYRIAGPKVRGLKLRSSFPAVNYGEIGKAETALPLARTGQEGGGLIRVPMSMQMTGLDPTLAKTVEDIEVLASIYETLIRDVGEAQIVPWLAAEFKVEEGGGRYRFRLRDDVHFHDGRRLTARDVRYSLERFLQNPNSTSRWILSPIRGAVALLERNAPDLAGFHIHSATEFTIELEKPVSFFLALMSFVGTAIVPEGTERFGSSWREGAVGTGPFRVVRFEPGRRLELERSPGYWREGFPRSQGLVFRFGVPPKEILSGFRAGQFSLAGDLFPADVEVLRHEVPYAAGYREAPRLSTYYAAFNIHRGPLSNRPLREKLVRAVDVPGLIRQTLGPIAIPAHGLIPPGLLGYEPARRSEPVSETLPGKRQRSVELSTAVHPVFTMEYSSLFDGIMEAFRRVGVKIRPATDTLDQYLEAVNKATVDLVLGRWYADYPDTDSLFAQILHTQRGLHGGLCGSPEIDQLIEKGRTEMDPEVRHSIYRHIGETLVREARLLPLFHDQVYRFARPEIEGLSVSYCFAYDTLRVRGQ